MRIIPNNSSSVLTQIRRPVSDSFLFTAQAIPCMSAFIRSDVFRFRRFIHTAFHPAFKAPSTSSKNSPLLANLLDITERGRSEGVVLFSAEQFRSAIHERIKGNCGTNVYGRTNAIEVSRPDYKFVPTVYANMMTRLKKGDLILHHPVFKTLLKIQFPFPSYNQGGSK